MRVEKNRYTRRDETQKFLRFMRTQILPLPLCAGRLSPSPFFHRFFNSGFWYYGNMESSQNLVLGVVGALGALILIALGMIIRLELRLKRLFRGKNAVDLENLLTDFAKALDSFDKWSKDAHSRMLNFDKELARSARHIGIVRFNPFKDAGGDQSAAIAILDDSHNGVVLSSIYGRDSSRTYAKPVVNGNSTYHLSEEEREAIARASSSGNSNFQ